MSELDSWAIAAAGLRIAKAKSGKRIRTEAGRMLNRTIVALTPLLHK